MTLTHEWEQFLEVQHQIKRKVWQSHKIRFDTDFLYLPYYSPSGDLIYEKKRKEPDYKGENKYLYPSGAHITLYPNQDLSKHTKWVLTEGELDALTLESIDIPAVTAGGVTSFKQELTGYFKGKKVFICFDNDKAGKIASEKVAQLLLEAGAEVLIVDLPEMEGGKDIGDYFRSDHTKNDFLQLVNKARKIKPDFQKASGTQTPDSINKQKLLDQEISYSEVEARVLKLLPNSQTGLKLILAVSASSSFPNPLMIWLLLVGVPSSGKTDLVRLIRDADSTYYLDNLTQNAFISGERASQQNKVHDLLPLLDKKCLVIKDWTSIFSLDEKMTKKLLGDLVGIYDKEFTKFSSRRGNISYSSAFSQLGCITPATLNRHTNYMNMVGPRFLCYTMPSTAPEAEDESYDLIFSNQDRSLIEKEARLYVSSYLTQIIKRPLEIKPISKEAQDYLRRAARLMSNCRGIVLLQAASFKNEDGEDIKYFEVLDVQVEEPWRAVQQLITLAKFLAFVSGKDEVGVGELQIIKEIVISSMPADRSQALRTIKEHGGQITAKELAELSDKSTKTSRRLLDELVALKALEKIASTARNIAADYQICEQFKDFVLLDPAEFMSHKESRGTETPEGIDSISSEPVSVINTIPGLEVYGH